VGSSNLMTQAPQDLSTLKAALKAITRRAVCEYVEILCEHDGGLVGYMVDECWPTREGVAQQILGELEARQQEGDNQK
jgi:hypothetical protein